MSAVQSVQPSFGTLLLSSHSSSPAISPSPQTFGGRAVVGPVPEEVPGSVRPVVAVVPDVSASPLVSAAACPEPEEPEDVLLATPVEESPVEESPDDPVVEP